MTSSPFIRAMHPKAEIAPDAAAISKILSMGWLGQLKIHGHRAQIHIPSDGRDPVAYNRQGQVHKLDLSNEMVSEIFRLFKPQTGWNVVDAEWIKPVKKLYVFDLLKHNGELLISKTFPERYAMLPRDFLSPHIQVLPIIKDLEHCLRVMESKEDFVEGLVFKSPTSTGFSDTSIVRCRKKGSSYR